MKRSLLKRISALASNRSEVFTALRSMRSTDVHENREHLRFAGEWLLVSQSIGSDGGYAHSYSLHGGWERSYAETTGYIIPSMLRLGEYLEDERYAASAFRAGSWLLSIQRPDGSFPDLTGLPQVFDTGQIIEGLLALFQKTGNEDFRSAATRAGDFLVDCQDEDGKWTTYTYQHLPHAYYTRVAANLLRLHAVTGEPRHKTAAEKQLQWTIGQQVDNGYFRHMAFTARELPFLHTIVYVLEGLLTGYELTQSEDLLRSLRKTVDRLIHISKNRDFILYSQYDEHWNPLRKEKCVTGLAQWAGLLLNLFSMTGERDQYHQAIKTLYYLKSKQVLQGSKGIRGALPGSVPLWGSYFRFAFNNWTVKFFIDALLHLEEHNHPLWHEQEIYVGESFQYTAGRYYDPGAVYLQSPYASFIESVIQAAPRGATFLDVGCGEGNLIRQLSTAYPETRFVGVDPTFAGQTRESASNLHIMKGTAYHLPVADNSVDCILFKEVLQHIAFPNVTFQEIRRVAKQGATVIVIERNPRSLLGLLKYPLELLGKWMYPWDSPFRERWHFKTAWVTMLKNLGRVEHFHKVNISLSSHTSVRWLLKYMDRFFVFIVSVRKEECTSRPAGKEG